MLTRITCSGITAVLLVIGASACGSKDDSGTPVPTTGPTVTDTATGPDCVDTSSPLAWNELAPDGTDPTLMIAHVEGVVVADLTIPGGTSGRIQIEVTRNGSPSVIVSELAEPITTTQTDDTGTEPPPVTDPCNDYVVIPVTVRVRSEDQQFDDTWNQDYRSDGAAPLRAAPPLVDMELRGVVDLSALGGSWRPADSQAGRVGYSGTLGGDQSEGRILFYAGEKGTEQSEDVGTWASTN